jgi:hypothetical protein
MIATKSIGLLRSLLEFLLSNCQTALLPEADPSTPHLTQHMTDVEQLLMEEHALLSRALHGGQSPSLRPGSGKLRSFRAMEGVRQFGKCAGSKGAGLMSPDSTSRCAACTTLSVQIS